MAHTISHEDKEKLLKELEIWLKQIGLYGISPFSTAASLKSVKTISTLQINKIREMIKGPFLEKTTVKKKSAKR